MSGRGAILMVVCLAAALAPARARGDDDARSSAAPSWLRAPATRGPLASLVAFDGRWAYGSLAAGLPLQSRLRATDARDALGREPSGFSVNGILAASDETSASDRDHSWLRGAVLLDRSAAHSGGWLGLASGEGRSASTSEVRMRIGGGVWRSLAPIQLEGSIVTSVVQFHGDPRWSRTVTQQVFDPRDSLFRDTSYTVAGDHVSRWLSGQGAARWGRGRLELEASGGITAGVAAPRRGWAQAAAQFQLSRRALLLASFGTRPAVSTAFDPTARPRSMIGVQLAPWSSQKWAMACAIRPSVRGWVLRHADEGRLAIFVRCRDVSLVELSGDFTDWVAAPLKKAGGDWWELTVPVDPGLHRVRMRLNGGAWEAPPGLPRSSDEGGPPAGVLLVE